MKCYTSVEEAFVGIQSLIDHSVKRLFRDPNLYFPLSENRLKFTYLDFKIKYSLDGLSASAKHNQKFSHNYLTDDSLLQHQECLYA